MITLSKTTTEEKYRTMSEESKNPRTSDDSVEEKSAPEPSSANSELDNLRQELLTKEAEAKENYDRFVRQVAELENFKRRSARDREEISRFANEGLIKDLLTVVDNLERAVAHASGGGNGKPIVEGVEMVLKGLLDVLAKHGTTQISAIGQPFDPTKHEAMAQVESDKHPANHVVEELHKGYLLRDRLLRPALVSVSKAPESQGKKNDDDKVEKDPGDG
jgi:molecular chaperone GrpE